MQLEGYQTWMMLAGLHDVAVLHRIWTGSNSNHGSFSRLICSTLQLETNARVRAERMDTRLSKTTLGTY